MAKRAKHVGWGKKEKKAGSQTRNDPRTKAVELLHLAQHYGKPFGLMDLVMLPTLYAKAWDKLIEEEKIVCVDERRRKFRIV
jgi:hypothetical protein